MTLALFTAGWGVDILAVDGSTKVFVDRANRVRRFVRRFGHVVRHSIVGVIHFGKRKTNIA